MLRLVAILAGATLTSASVVALGRLIAPRTALPHAIRCVLGATLYSILVFAVLAFAAGNLPVYISLFAVLAALACFARTACAPRLPRMHWFPLALVAGYGVMYLVCALAPEIQPDAFGYHLRVVSDYVRQQGFTNRLTFYDALPQGLEMLFVPAFAIGGGEAAKLVHLCFLCLSISLIRELAVEAGVKEPAGSIAGALFFLAPVSGVAGTAAYTDAGLICASLTVIWLLLRWEKERLTSLLLCAALCAGFCYTIKPTFGWVLVAGFGFVTLRSRRITPAIAFAGAGMAIVIPWAARAWWLTGNPVAPFLSAWFPNPVSTPDLERNLTASYSAFRSGFSLSHALLNYTLAGGNQGLLGAAFLALPLSLLSLRHKGGRRMLIASALLAIPVIANTGTRFLLPALGPASIALAAAAPVPAGLALVALQAVGSLPGVMDLYERKNEWRLREIPVRAALGMTDENVYLHRAVQDFPVVDLLNAHTPSNAQILALVAVPEAYIHREILLYWQSAEALKLTDILDFANMSHGTRARQLSWRWNCGEYQAMRLTANSNIRLIETHLHGAQTAPRSWKNLPPRTSVQIASLADSTGADLLIWPGDQGQETTDALRISGTWEHIGAKADRAPRIIDVRRDATSYLRRRGYPYILVKTQGDAFTSLAADLMTHPFEWGVEAAGHTGNIWLFHILPDLI